jgi:hypothetical protein
MILPVRTALRLLMCLAIFCSLGLAAMPTRVAAAQVKTGCCAKMKKEAEAKDCGQHAPKSNEDKQCCSLCVFCLATLASMVTPFVYPLTGEESFAAFISREHARSHRPPVPPPRAA